MRRKIVVCVPTPDRVHSVFAFDLFQAVVYHMLVTHAQDIILPIHHECALLMQQRQTLAELALDRDATHVLWLDSDMRFPPDLIGRLLAHDVDFVAANCSKRKEPVEPTAMDLEFNRIWPDPDVEGLQEVSVVGFAVVMMKADMLRGVGSPWFEAQWLPSKGYFAGEDMYFCKKANEAGYKLWIDHDLSWEIQHVGSKGYSMIDCVQEGERRGNL